MWSRSRNNSKKPRKGVKSRWSKCRYIISVFRCGPLCCHVRYDGWPYYSAIELWCFTWSPAWTEKSQDRNQPFNLKSIWRATRVTKVWVMYVHMIIISLPVIGPLPWNIIRWCQHWIFGFESHIPPSLPVPPSLPAYIIYSSQFLINTLGISRHYKPSASTS